MDGKFIAADTILLPNQWVVIHSPHYPHPVESLITKIDDATLSASVDDLSHEEYVASPVRDSIVTIKLSNKSGHFETDVKYLGNSPLPQKIFFLERPTWLRHSQMREFVRIPATLSLIYKTRNIYNGFNNAKKTCLINISGNGLCFVTDKAINRSSTMSILIYGLPGIESLSLWADVIRCRQVTVPYGTVYQIGVCFQNYISRSQHTQLLHSLTTMQRKYLNKGIH